MAGFAATCPCSTVHRLRIAEFRKDYEAHSFAAAPSRFGVRDRSRRRSIAVSAKSKRDPRGGATGKVSGAGISRRSVMGLLALVSPALLMSGGARSDVQHIDESEKMRLDMLESIEKRVAANAQMLESVQPLPSTTAPPLSEETISQASNSSPIQAPEAVAGSSAAAPPETPETVASVSDSTPESQFVETKMPDLQETAAAPSISTAFSPEEKIATAREDNGPPGFLNVFGVIGSGILGAMYWLEGRAKAATKLALAEANTKLEASQATLADLKRAHAAELGDQRAEFMTKLKASEEQRVELCNEITVLSSGANEMHLQIDSQKNVNENLNKKVKSSGETIQALQSSLHAIEDKLVHEEQRRQALETEVRSGGVQIRERDEKIVGLEAAVKELGSSEDELRSDLFAARTALGDAEDRIQNLVKELIVSQSCLEERGDTVHDLEQRLAEANSRADRAEQSLDSTERELKEQLQIANAGLASKEEEIQAANLELDAARADAKQFSLVIENFQQQVEDLERSSAREQESIQKLSEELSSAREEIQAKAAEASSLSEEIQSNETELECLRKQKKETEAMAEAKLRSLRESLRTEQAETGRMKQELDETTTSFQSASMEIKSIGEKLRETIVVNKKIQEELDDVRQTADGTLALLNDEKKKVAMAEQQYIETQKSLAREEILVQSLRSEFSKAMDAMNDLRKHLSSLSKDLQDANVKVAALESDRSVLQAALSKEKSAARKMRDKASYAESELAKLVQEREGSMGKARKLEEELAAAESEMGKLKQQMVVMGSVIDSAETRMGSIQQVNAEVASLARRVGGGAASSSSSPKEQEQTLQRQIDKLKEQSKAASDITKELKSMKRLLSHFQQNLNEAELDRVEAEAALQAAVKRNMVTVSDEAIIQT